MPLNNKNEVADLTISYSFSFKNSLILDVKYFRNTTPKHSLNRDIERFILKFLKNNGPRTFVQTITRGRPKKPIKLIKQHGPLSIPLKTSTVEKIKQYKKLKDDNRPNLDHVVEAFIRIQIPRVRTGL